MKIDWRVSILIAVLFPIALLGQTAVISGSVLDQTGVLIPGVKVAAFQSTQAIAYRGSTDEHGAYKLSGLAAGTYSLTLELAGFERLRIRSISIDEGQQKRIPPMELVVGQNCTGRQVVDFVQVLDSSSGTGDLLGTVSVDLGPMVARGPGVSGAIVELFCGTKGVCGSTKTDAKGEFVFRAIEPGGVSVGVTKPGFYRLEEHGFEIKSNLGVAFYPIYLERCRGGNCDPRLRPKKPRAFCE